MFIKSVIFLLIYLIIIKDNLIKVFSFEYLKELLQFGAPLVPSTIIFMVITLSDRYFLSIYTNFEQIGVYTFGYRIGMIIALVVNSFQIAWPSIMFSIYKEENAKEKYSVIFTKYISFILFVGLIICIFSKEIIQLIGTEQYKQSNKIIPLIVLSYIFVGVYYMTSIGINVKKKTKYEPLIMIIALLINIFLNYLLIRPYGIIGAGITNASSFMLLSFMACWLSNKFYKIHYQIKKIVSISITTILIIMTSQFSGNYSIIIRIMINIPLVLIFIYIIHKTKIIKLNTILNSISKNA
jgi:O-antigen/teichoic acid export membrane protein